MDEFAENWGLPGASKEVVLPPQPEIEIDQNTREVMDAMFAVSSIRSRIAAIEQQIAALHELGEQADLRQLAELRTGRTAYQEILPDASKYYKELSERYGIFLR